MGVKRDMRRRGLEPVILVSKIVGSSPNADITTSQSYILSDVIPLTFPRPNNNKISEMTEHRPPARTLPHYMPLLSGMYFQIDFSVPSRVSLLLIKRMHMELVNSEKSLFH